MNENRSALDTPEAVMPIETTPSRRLHWQLFHENGWGVMLTDLDTEQWAVGSAESEDEARRIALRNLDDRPSGGKPDPRWSAPAEPMTLPVARRILTVWKGRESGPGADAMTVVLDAAGDPLSPAAAVDLIAEALADEHVDVKDPRGVAAFLDGWFHGAGVVLTRPVGR